jgi:hypothetical protein
MVAVKPTLFDLLHSEDWGERSDENDRDPGMMCRELFLPM